MKATLQATVANPLCYFNPLCSDRVQLQASRAQLSVHLVHLIIMGGRELPDPPVLFH